MSKLFISHSSRDNAQALALSQWLHTQGWDEQFLDLDPERGIVAGERWEQALYQAAHSCEAVLFLISTNWLASNWCLKEFRLAHKLNKRIFGVLTEDIAVADLPAELTEVWQLVNLSGGSDHGAPFVVTLQDGSQGYATFSSSGLARLRTGLAKAGLDPKFFAWPPAHDPNRPPYRGLLPLEAEDAGIFFGREASLIDLMAQLRGLRDSAPPRLLAILGASGAGKSSFLRAGLLPRLARDERHFYPLPLIRPERAALSGNNGFLAMLVAVNNQLGLGYNRAHLRTMMDGDGNELATLLRNLRNRVAPPELPGETPRLPPTLIVAIDQAEELFFADGSDEARQLLELLHKLLTDTNLGLAVVVTIRSDTYEQLQTAPQLEGMAQHTFSLAPLARGSYQQVIEGPALLLAKTDRPLTIEPQLTQQLLQDLDKGGGKDALPLLAFTLERLYREYGDDGDLRLEEYHQMGGIQGAIEAAVDNALKDAMTDPKIPRDKEECLKLLRRGLIPWLAGIDPNTQQPRRRIARLDEIPEEARSLIHHFIQHHLLATDRNEQGEITIEPAHESLLRQWQRLRGWLEEDSAALATLDNLQNATRDWEANARDANWLVHTQGRLEDAEVLVHREDLRNFVRQADREYLGLCRTAENARKNKELEEARRFASAQKQIVKRTLWGLSVSICLIFVSCTLGYWAILGERKAKQQLAETRSLLAQIQGNLEFMNKELRNILELYVPINQRINVVQQIDDLAKTLNNANNNDLSALKQQAIAYATKADLLMNSDTTDLSAALDNYKRAQSIFLSITKNDPADVKATKNLVSIRIRVGAIELAQGNTGSAQETLLASLDLAQELLTQHPDDLEVMRQIFNCRMLVGDTYGKTTGHSASIEQFELSLKIGQHLLKKLEEPGVYQEVVYAYMKTVEAYSNSGNMELALKKAHEGLTLAEDMTKRYPEIIKGNLILSRSYILLGQVYAKINEPKTSHQYLQKGLDTASKLETLDPDNKSVKSTLASAYDLLSELASGNKEYNDALEKAERSLIIYSNLFEEDKNDINISYHLMRSHNKIGDILKRNGNKESALNHYNLSLDIQKLIVDKDPSNLQSQRNLGIGYGKLGEMALTFDNITLALTYFQKSLDIAKDLANRDFNNLVAQRDLGASYWDIGNTLSQSGKPSESITFYQSSLDVYLKLYKIDPKQNSNLQGLAYIHGKLGDANSLIDTDAAVSHYMKSIEFRKVLAQKNPSDIDAKLQLAILYGDLSRLYSKRGDSASTLKWYQMDYELIQSILQERQNDVGVLRHWFFIESDMGRYFERQAQYEKALRAYRNSLKALQIMNKIGLLGDYDKFIPLIEGYIESLPKKSFKS